MEIRQLEYFRAIVDAGTISGAARALHMTQPPLSYQMKLLEEELQVSLFQRGTKRITLTEAGKTLYEQAGNLLIFSELTKREVFKSGQTATLPHEIGTSTLAHATACKNTGRTPRAKTGIPVASSSAGSNSIPSTIMPAAPQRASAAQSF